MLIWYLARAAGLAAFLSLSVATGVGAYTSRRTTDPAARVVWQYVHRAAALSGVVLLVLHIVTILADAYADVGLSGLLPFGSGYRPLAVTLGVLSLYAVAAVWVTGVLRTQMSGSPGSAGLWRRIHLLSYGAWLLAAGHFLLVGSDTGQWWALATLAGGTAAVAAGITARLSDRGPTITRTGTAAPNAAGR